MKRVRRKHTILRMVGAGYKTIAFVILFFSALVALLFTGGLLLSPRAFEIITNPFGIPALLCTFLSLVAATGGFTAVGFWVIASLIEITTNIDYKIDLIAAKMLEKERLPDEDSPSNVALTHKERVEKYLRQAEREGKW